VHTSLPLPPGLLVLVVLVVLVVLLERLDSLTTLSEHRGDQVKSR
jgi:hypothetical protein